MTKDPRELFSSPKKKDLYTKVGVRHRCGNNNQLRLCTNVNFTCVCSEGRGGRWRAEGFAEAKVWAPVTCAHQQLIEGNVSSTGVLTSQPEFMHSVDCQSDLDYMLLSGSRKLSQQRREPSSILITVGFIWMQRRKLHLAMRSSDDHNAINRGEWAAVCLCLLWELQQLVWSASGDIWAQYTWWISFICRDLDGVFSSYQAGQPFRQTDYVIVESLQETKKSVKNIPQNVIKILGRGTAGHANAWITLNAADEHRARKAELVYWQPGCLAEERQPAECDDDACRTRQPKWVQELMQD